MVRWAPAHAGVEGNEHADATAKRAAEGGGDRAEGEYLGEASSLTSRERLLRPGSRLPEGGSGTMSGKSAATAPRRAGGSGRGSARFGKSWQAGSSNSCQATLPRRFILNGSIRPLTASAGCAVAARVSRTTTCPSSAGAGRRRFKGCGRGSRRTVSGSPRGPLLHGFSSVTSVQPPPSWSSWRAPGWGGCRAWLLEWRRRRRRRRRSWARWRCGPAHPRMYVTSFLCLFLCLSCFFFRGCRVAGGDTPL